MKAFAQPLSGIFRTGPVADQYGKDWDYQVTWLWVDAITCTLYGLKADGGFTMAHGRAVAKAARKEGFKRLQWDRAGDEEGGQAYGMVVELHDDGTVARIYRTQPLTLQRLEPNGRESHQRKHHANRS